MCMVYRLKGDQELGRVRAAERKGQKGPESLAQDLRLGLEHAGLLPHGLLVVSIVVVDAPIRGYMLTP